MVSTERVFGRILEFVKETKFWWNEWYWSFNTI